MTRRQTTTISIFVIIVIALGFMVSRKFWVRFDLTKNKAYTISKASRNLYKEIPNQILITYYVSDKLKSMFPFPGEIEDLLREYAAYSHGKIVVTVRDPAREKDSNGNPITQNIEQMGIQPQQMQNPEQGGISIITVYSGIVIDYIDKDEILPFITSLSTLEYDLTSRIRSLVSNSTRQAGIIAGDDPQNFSQEYQAMQNALTQAGYRLQLVTPGADIAADMPLLIVMGGVETLDAKALYQIDKYIQTGGRVFFAVKAIGVDKQQSMEARALQDKGLLAMLSSYGATVKPEIVMDRTALPMQYQTQSQNGWMQIKRVNNSQWIRLLPENGNKDNPIGANFKGLDMYWASPIVLNAPPSMDVVPLFTTTQDAWSMTEPFYTNPEVSYLFEKDASSTKGTKVMGASLTGVFPSWFKDKPKPDASLPAMPDTAKPSRVIVVSDTDFLSSMIGATNATHNLDFLLQGSDWLVGNLDDIIGIRNRESNTANLNKISDPQAKASAILFAQVFNIVIMPVLVIAAAIIIALRRRAKSRVHSDQSNDSPHNENNADSSKGAV
ncbi:MAG: GldG family protein [Treponema sp.]|nr:GldG family protein [Treponema sp.]